MKCLQAIAIICGGFCSAALWGQGGTVTSITAGSGLLGGTITTSGTLSLNLNSANTWAGAQSFSSNATFAANATFPGGIWNSSGAVGIGTTSPAYSLDVSNSTSTAARIGAYGTLTSVNSTHLALMGGANFNGTSWIAQSPTPAGLAAWQGDLYFVANTGVAVGSAYNQNVIMKVQGSNGSVGIGTTSPQHLLHVAGTIGAEEVIVSSTGADYVFDPDYRLAPLNEVAGYINQYHHLPDVPSAAEIQRNGASVGEMQAKLLAKIEELTLHMIEEHQRNTNLEQQNRQLQEQNRMISEKIAALEAKVSQ